jgi:hypothetical protein
MRFSERRNRDVGGQSVVQPRRPTNRWTGATGSDLRIIIGPAKPLSSAVARSTQTFARAQEHRVEYLNT